MYQTILTPVDGGEPSRSALQHALSIANAFDATVHVLTVVEPADTQIAFGIDEVGDINHALADLIDTIVTAGGPTEIEVHSDVRRGKPVYEQILTYATEIDADLIVLGRHGAISLPDAVLGSTADRIARLANVPVTLVPATEHRSPEPEHVSINP